MAIMQIQVTEQDIKDSNEEKNTSSTASVSSNSNQQQKVDIKSSNMFKK